MSSLQLKVPVWVPIKTDFHNDNGTLVIRAEVRLPADSWNRPHYPTDAQVEAALAKALSLIDLWTQP